MKSFSDNLQYTMRSAKVLLAATLAFVFSWASPTFALAESVPFDAPARLVAIVRSNGAVRVSWEAGNVDSTTARYQLVRSRLTTIGVYANSVRLRVPPGISRYIDSPGPGTFRYRLRVRGSQLAPDSVSYVQVQVRGGKRRPTATPQITVTRTATSTPTVVPTTASTIEPTIVPSVTPSVTATSQPTRTATATPSSTRTLSPTLTPSRTPTYLVPTSTATPVISRTATATPTPVGNGAATLVPGTGFSGPTLQPSAVGSAGDSGRDAQAIARWDVVPYQDFSGSLQIGVIAFHINGIDRVEFSVNGGPWVAVTAMTYNIASNVHEYWVTLRASDLPDGLAEIRAIAYPRTAGIPRVLSGAINADNQFSGEHSLFLNANSGATLQAPTRFVSPTGLDSAVNDGSQLRPFRTIAYAARSIELGDGSGLSDGATIYLMAGDHVWGPDGIYYPRTNQRYLTVRAAPGLSRSDVRLINSPATSGLRTKMVHLENVTILGEIYNSLRDMNPAVDPVIWFSNCYFSFSDITSLVLWARDYQYTGGIYVTDSKIEHAKDGWRGGTLLRNVQIVGIGDDALGNNRMVVNAEVTGIVNPPSAGFHSDVMQFETTAPAPGLENIIVYNLRAYNNRAQGFYIDYTSHLPGPEWSDLAFVNILNDHESATSQWAPSANHVLWWNMTYPHANTTVIIEDTPVSAQYPVPPPTTIRNFSLKNSVFNRLGIANTGASPQVSSNLSPESWAQDIHVIDVSNGSRTVGVDKSSGGSALQLFVDPSSFNFRPRSGSILLDRVDPLVSPADVENEEFVRPGPVGALMP